MRDGPEFTMVIASSAVVAAETALNDAMTRREAFMKDLTAQRRSEWLAGGGCRGGCGGSGYVLTWSTLDGEGYNEFGRCKGIPNGEIMRYVDATEVDALVLAEGCELVIETFPGEGYNGSDYVRRRVIYRGPSIPCTAETVGPCPGETFNRCNHPRPLGPVPPLCNNAHEVQQLADLDEDIAMAKAQLTERKALWAAIKGATVTVRKGRKVPVGTVAVIGWIGPNEYSRSGGDRFGLRVVGEEKTVYTTEGNVEVTVPAPDAVDDLPRLGGTDAQISWAERIRRQMITDGKFTVEQARTVYSAKQWIDHDQNAKRADEPETPGMPRLKGSTAQVSWAERIRAGAIRAGKLTADEAKKIVSAKVFIEQYR